MGFVFIFFIYFIVVRKNCFLRDLVSFIRIDYSFVLLLVLAIFLESVFIYFLHVVFIVLHELAHLIVAKRLGYLPKKLKLTMFGASLEGFDDFLLIDEIKIILAGPLLNLLIAIFCYLSFWFYPESFCYLQDVLMVNLSILFFNMLPIFPLDAGRLILCLSSLNKGRVYGVKFVKKLSFVFVLILFIFSVFSIFIVYNFTLGFVAINLCILLFETGRGTSYKREIVFRKKIGRLKRGIVQKVVYVTDAYPYELLIKFLDAEHYFIFVFVDDNFHETNRIEERELLEMLGFI